MNGLAPALIKKYGNRRLYDTEDSRYLTLEELATKIRKGRDVRIIDAKTEEDITQGTLAQLIFEGATSKLLPVNLLMQLIRLGDDSVGEFFSRYVTWALDLYVQAKRGVSSVTQLAPGLQSFPGISQLPSAAVDVMNRIWLNNPLMQMAGFPFGNGQGAGGNGYGGVAPSAHGPNGNGATAAPVDVPSEPPAGDAPRDTARDDIDALRREVAELRRSMEPVALGKPGAKRKPLR